MEDLDLLLAMQLQEKYQSEFQNFSTNKENEIFVSTPVKSHFTTSPKKPINSIPKKCQTPPSTSLLDPSWETVDPTPDIYALFAAFNERFFWNRLCSVEVKWSPRMTSCAGVCSYQGRGGLCSVRLSEPLLKLRPRSDLVNTLLHEMIHAYLFVTANNRDRDGHGPEFHKHMYRINKEAGTKITVYHSFHDEVRLYQQHWWRCNGPCQNRKPFYGFVKRAMNRAPGPYDTWWANHQAECGGTFVKIREPEDYGKKKKSSSKISHSASNSKSASDIRTFFPTSPSPTKSPSSERNGVHGFKNLHKSTPNLGVPKTVKPSSSSKPPPNLFAFNDLNKPSTSSAGNRNSHGFIAGGLKNKGSSTFVIPPKSRSKTEDEKPANFLNIQLFKPFEGSGQKLGGQENDKSKSKLLTLFPNQLKSGKEPSRSLLINVSSGGNSSRSGNRNGHSSEKNQIKPAKRSSNESEHSPVKKSCADKNESTSNDDVECSRFVNCPVCLLRLVRYSLSSHLENCPGLQNIFSDSTNESGFSDDEDFIRPKEISRVSSPIIILSDSEDELPEKVPEGSVKRKKPDENLSAESEVPCPCCNKVVLNSKINQHLDDCLSQIAIEDFT